MKQQQHNSSPPDEQLLTSPEVAAMYGVTTRTASRWSREGRFGDAAVKLPGGHWRYRAAALREQRLEAAS